MTPKQLEKIKNHFQESFSQKTTLTALDKYESKKRMIAENYMVYSFSALPLLIEKMKQLAIDKYQARFVVDENGDIWFAVEGSPGSDIEYSTQFIDEQAPAHSVMLQSGIGVVSAGIVVFSKDYQIKKITNFSGHFRPNVGTLVWPLASLLHLDADFTTEVELGFFWKNQYEPLQSKTVLLPKRELHTLLPSTCAVAPHQTHEVRVFSNHQWEHFGPAQEPHFKEKQKRAASSMSLDHANAPLYKRSNTSMLFFSHPDLNNSQILEDVVNETILQEAGENALDTQPAVLNTAQFVYLSPSQSPKHRVMNSDPFSDEEENSVSYGLSSPR